MLIVFLHLAYFYFLVLIERVEQKVMPFHEVFKYPLFGVPVIYYLFGFLLLFVMDKIRTIGYIFVYAGLSYLNLQFLAIPFFLISLFCGTGLSQMFVLAVLDAFSGITFFLV